MDDTARARLTGAGWPNAAVIKAEENRNLIEAKLEKLTKLYDPNTKVIPNIGRVVLLLGTDSPVKDWFALALAKFFVENDRRVLLCGAESFKGESAPTCYALFVSGLSYQTEQPWVMKKMGRALRDHVGSGRVIVLEANSIEDIEASFGTAFVDYISHFGVTVQFDEQRQPMTCL